MPQPTFDPASVKLRIDLIVDGLETPVYVTDDGSDAACLYVVERGGVVRVVDADGFVRPKPFLDISALVTEGTEQGLHAIAFHPDFADNGRFFAHYNDKEGRTQIAEFRGTPCRTAGSKPVKSLLLEEQPFPNNNAGWIGFGPDGYLYIPLGDGGGVSPGDPNGIGQATSSRLSKVLRIDVNVRSDKLYAIPRDNPYAKKRKGFPPRDVGHGPARPAPLQLRPDDRRPLDRRRRPGQLRGGEPHPGGRLRRSTSAGPTWRATAATTCPTATHRPTSHRCPSTTASRRSAASWAATSTAAAPSRSWRASTSSATSAAASSGASTPTPWRPASRPSAQLLLDAPQGFVSFGEDDAGELYLVALDGSIYRIAAEEA